MLNWAYRCLPTPLEVIDTIANQPFLFLGYFGFVGGAIFLLRYLWWSSYSQLQIWCCPTRTNLAIVRGLSTLRRRRYSVPLWVRSGHLQTLFTPLVKPSPDPHYERTMLKNPECGGTIVLDIHNQEVAGPTNPHSHLRFFSSRGQRGTSFDQLKPVVFIVPGVSSNRSSAYIRSAIGALGREGFKVVLVNHRGGEFAPPQLSSPQIFTVGGTTDLRTAIEHFRRVEPPGTPFLLVGFSLGANICVNYVSEYEDVGTELQGAISICQGYDGKAGVERLDATSPFYSKIILYKLKAIVQKHESVLRNNPKINWDAVLAATTVAEFDTAFSAPLHGFASAADYYRHHSCISRIGRTRIPLLLVNSTDDPFLSADLLKLSIESAKSQPNIIAVHSSKGGHLGFWEGGLFIPYSRSWADRLICEFASLMAVLPSPDSASLPGSVFSPTHLSPNRDEED